MRYRDGVDVVLLAPLDEVAPHLGHVLELELAGSQEPQQVRVVELRQLRLGQRALELLERLLLLGREVAQPAESLKPYPVYFSMLWC